MEKLFILFCLAGLVTAAIVGDTQSPLERKAVDQRILLSRENLSRQKIILDLLRGLELPFENQQLSERNIDCSINENIILGPLDENARRVLDLIRSNRDQERKTICSINSLEDLRNLGGLYLLLVRSRDFDALQQISECGRRRLSPVLFANALILALEQRSDTQSLIIPALYEILPKLYVDESLVSQLDAINERRSNRVNIQDIMKQAEQTRQQQRDPNVSDRSEIWLPWRDIHRQLAIQKTVDGRIVSRADIRQEVTVLSSSKTNGLLGNDVGLRSFLDLLFTELVLKESVLRVEEQSQQPDPIVDSRNNVPKFIRFPGGKVRIPSDRVVRAEEDGDIGRQFGRRDNDDVIRQSEESRGFRSSRVSGSRGQRLLSVLQQLVARLNIEDISLSRNENENNILRQLDDRQRQVLLDKMNEISERIRGAIQNRLRQVSENQQNLQRDNEIDHIILVEILNEVTSLSDLIHDGQVSSLLRDLTTQLLLSHIVRTVGRQLQQLQGVRNVKEIAQNGVRINNVDVDRLQTYLENTNIDLNNLDLTNLNSRDENIQRQTIGRVPRLNHRPFAIRLDVNSDRNQQVVIRTLLLPKVDSQGLRLTAYQQRENVIVLDINRVNLQSGKNLIVRQSRDINWTSRATTSYSELYRSVLGALRNGQDLLSDIRVGENHLLPQRLLLPRGRLEGLQMQLLMVITPANDNRSDLRNDLRGLDALVVDDLPLTYPLDREIDDINEISILPNVILKDIRIFHKDELELKRI